MSLTESRIVSSRSLILVDTSYYIYSIYYAGIIHHRKCYQTMELADTYNWLSDDFFVSHVEKQFAKKIADLTIKMGAKNPTYIWAKDCPTSEIWRNHYITGYKGTRVKKPGVGDFFRHVYDKLLVTDRVIAVDNCEADDIIAQIALYHAPRSAYDCIYIITSDTDYLQLTHPKIGIYDITGVKKHNTNESYALHKAICGDISDNIPNCKFTRASMKTIGTILETKPQYKNLVETALKKIKTRPQQDDDDDKPNRPLDMADMTEFEGALYRNLKLIDFTMIPVYYKSKILDTIIEK